MKKLIRSKLFIIKISISLIILSSCSNGSRYDTCKNVNLVKLSSLIRQYEDLNRIEFKYHIVEGHLKSSKSNFLNKGIIELTFQVDSLVDELIVSSGGMNYNGELVGGCNKNLASIKFRDFSIIQNIERTIIGLKQRNVKQPVFNGNVVIKQLESSLKYLAGNYENDEILENTTVMVLIFDLVLFNNYLLLIETKYFETLNQCE